MSRVIEAQLALASAPQEEIPLREQQVALAKQAEEQMKKKIKVGTAAPLDELLTRYERLTAECDLFKGQAPSQFKVRVLAAYLTFGLGFLSPDNPAVQESARVITQELGGDYARIRSQWRRGQKKPRR